VTNQAASFRFVKSDPPGRFSVVVPKSVAKSAVLRNTIRRQVYTTLSSEKHSLNGIFYIKKEYTDLSKTRPIRNLLEAAEAILARS